MNGNRLWKNREIFTFLRLSQHFTFLIVTRERSVEIDRFFFQNVRLIEAHLLVWLWMGVWCSPSELRVKNCRKSDNSANPNFSKCNPNLVWKLGDASHREESENAHFDVVSMLRGIIISKKRNQYTYSNLIGTYIATPEDRGDCNCVRIAWQKRMNFISPTTFWCLFLMVLSEFSHLIWFKS